MIRPATPKDARAVCDIYNYYIEHTIVTFEEEKISEQEMAKRMGDIAQEYFWLVLEEEGEIKGYAYATKWKARSAYRFAVEVTVYLKQGEEKKGYGRALYTELFRLLKAKGIHCLIAGVSLPNEGSVALHEKMGFKEVGVFHEVGFKFGKWIGTGYWEMHI